MWGRRRGGQGGGSVFRPRCFCSQTWQSLCVLQLQHWQAQPRLLLYFLPSLPGSSGTAQHQGMASAGTPAELAELGGDLIPRGTASPSEHHGCEQYRGRASQPQEEENLRCSHGVPSPGVGQEMLPSQGDALAPSTGKAQGGSGACIGLPCPSATMIYISTAQIQP